MISGFQGIPRNMSGISERMKEKGEKLTATRLVEMCVIPVRYEANVHYCVTRHIKYM